MAITVNNFTQKYTNPTAGTRQTSYRLYLEIKENSYDVATNSSNVSYTAWIIGTSTSTTFYGSTMNGVIKQGDTVLAEGSATATKSKPVSSANKYILASGSDDFKHNDDGTLSITLTFTYSSSAGHASAGETEATLKLTNIPRAHGILATDAFIETPPTITVTGKIADFTTTIEYEFGDLKGKIAEKTNNVNITDWVIPDTFYAQIPNDPFDFCKLTATTYNGNNPIGSNTYEFKVTEDPDRCRPTATITAVDTNETTKNLTDGTGKVVVIGKSNVLCEVTRTPQKSATIKSVKVNGTELGTATTQVLFNNVNTNVFEVVATDSRGYTNTQQIETLGKVDYIDTSIKAEVVRNTPTDGKVNIKFSGNYFNKSFGNVANTLDVQYKYKEKNAEEYSTPQSLTFTLNDDNTYSGEVKEIEGFDYQKEYLFQVIATDKLSSAPKTPIEIVVNRGEPMWWWDEEAFRVLTDFLVKDRNILNEIGTLSSLSTTNKGNLVGAINELVSSVGNATEIDSCSFANSGYIRFKNGFQIAWNIQQALAGGTAWENVFYSDHSMGNWAKAFTTCYMAIPYCNNSTFWTGNANASATFAGNLRCFRPNDSTATVWMGVLGIGKWK